MAILQGMQYPNFSIITPSYNQAAYFDQTLQAMKDQQYPNLQYLVMDGGSTDNTLSLIQNHLDIITEWVSEKDHGPAHAINKGLERANGDIISWINSDDYYEPGTLTHVAEIFNQHPEANCYIGKIRFIQEGTIPFYSHDIIFPSVAKTIGFGRIVQPAMFFRKSAIAKMGLLNETLHYCFDLEWWLKYLLVFGIDSIVTDEQLLVNFRFHPTSKSSSETQHFPVEKDNIYYSLAMQTGNAGIANIISKHSNINENYSFNIPMESDKNIISTALNYFLLLRGNEHYINFNVNAAKDYFGAIDKSLLNQEDTRLLRRLSFRNKFIPNFLIRLFRK